MKKILYIVLSILLMSTLVSCSEQTPADMKDVAFYYLKNEPEYGSESPVISKVVRSVPAGDSYESIMKLFLNGPITYDCVSPFPGGTELIEMYTEGNRATLVISPHLSTLSPSAQTLACACLTRTVIELTGVLTVHIRIENGLINGEETAVFNIGSFSYIDSMTQQDVAQQSDQP